MDLWLMGNKIKAERNRLKLTLEAFSEQIGISSNYLWEIEAGRKAPALNTLYNLSVALNVSIDYLLGVTDEKKSISGDTKRDFEIARIMKMLNNYEAKELSLISNIIQDFSKYFEQK